ncbi:hypothetical protein DM02DRAFT_734139 [Periconia macrospinosa]|uniref:Aminoglycoside phosphotransferase domain-containing protein n=1 Tax=Periconia macrospinosa TaxID=97972 RepID=A0A2V1D0H6_9PLEO|nr:hypothetical protein DM02DRAFT_734139 [Periconia macrospinosa]
MDELYYSLSHLASSVRNQIPCEPLKAPSFPGTSHFVCVLRFEDGVEWVARVSSKALSLKCPLPQEDIDRFASEISTLRWLKEKTSVKVPKLYAWNIPGPRNLAASDVSSGPQVLNTDSIPWMMVEKLTGVSLTYEMWNGFTDMERQKILAQVADLYAELSRHPFPEIGSLHTEPEPPYATRTHPRIYRYSFASAPVVPTDLLSLTATYRSTMPSITDPAIRGIISDIHQGLLANNPFPKEFFLAHPDLNPTNIILDPQSLLIAGFIDWDCAHTVSPMEFCIHPWFIQDRWYVDWDSEGLTRNQRDRDWFTAYIRTKTKTVQGSSKIQDRYDLANGFEQSLGVYLFGQFLHDTVCINPETLSAMYSKLEPVIQGYRQSLKPQQVGK